LLLLEKKDNREKRGLGFATPWFNEAKDSITGTQKPEVRIKGRGLEGAFKSQRAAWTHTGPLFKLGKTFGIKTGA